MPDQSFSLDQLPVPIVRHWIACEELETDSTLKKVTLRNLCQMIKPQVGESFPLQREKLCLFGMLTDARGTHWVQLQVAYYEEFPNKVSIQSAPARKMSLGNDPVAIRGLPIPLNGWVFEKPGQYEFRLICDGAVIASESIWVRAAS